MLDSQDLHKMEPEIIGLSEQQRPLVVKYLGNRSLSNPLKVFIIAGQHGNEKHGRKATRLLIDSIHDSFETDFPSVQLVALLDANPDGSIQKTRKNAIGIDLNRDHQRLDSKELVCIHNFVRAWKPHVIVDVHNIRSKRKDLLAKNLILYHDVFVDIPTNPAIVQPLDKNKIEHFLQTVQSDLKLLGITCDKYAMLKRSDRVRFSTLDVNEALNSFSLRYGIFTILLEGRTPIREEGESDKKHVVSAQYNALLTILKWMQKNKEYFTDNKHAIIQKGSKFALRSRYGNAGEPFKMTFRNAITKNAEIVDLKNNYTNKLEITKYIELPTAYAVPLDKPKVIEILNRQGFASHPSDPSKIEKIEYYDMVPKEGYLDKVKPKNMSALPRTEQRQLDRYILFPINQEGGYSLAMFLEPRSKYGLQRYDDLGLAALPGSQYPILRVIS